MLIIRRKESKMADGFTEKITVLDEFDAGGESFRLVNKGAGPDELQVKKDGEWVAETDHYVHGLLTRRVKELSELKAELEDFAIWMTGCGYDFYQHDYFCKQRDKLLKG